MGKQVVKTPFQDAIMKQGGGSKSGGGKKPNPKSGY